MKKLMLLRVTEKEALYTFGVLLDSGIPFAVTCELPWAGNARSLSCIPEGRYSCKQFTRKSGEKTFILLNVAGRESILFHKGNSRVDTEGCILIGEQFEQVNQPTGGPVPGILGSGKGFTEFMQRYGKEKMFELTIRRA